MHPLQLELVGFSFIHLVPTALSQVVKPFIIELKTLGADTASPFSRATTATTTTRHVCKRWRNPGLLELCSRRLIGHSIIVIINT